jgi:hypothetical protein
MMVVRWGAAMERVTELVSAGMMVLRWEAAMGGVTVVMSGLMQVMTWGVSSAVQMADRLGVSWEWLFVWALAAMMVAVLVLNWAVLLT